MSSMERYRETIITYLRSETTEDAAKALGITPTTLHGRLAMLRKQGVNVPKKVRRGGLNSLEIAQLNSLIKKHVKDMQEA